MKKSLCFLIVILSFLRVDAQKKMDGSQIDYRRSSLCLIMIDEDKMPKRELIKNVFVGVPVPDKYEDHNIGMRIFSADSMTITDEDIAAYRKAVLAGVEAEKAAEEQETEGEKKKGGFGKMIGGLAKDVAKGVVSDASGGLVDTSNKENYAVKAYKYLMEQRVAKQLFDKWFVDSMNNFSTALMQKRGLYDASVLDAQVAKGAMRGEILLRDAGKELVANTFVIVTRYRYLSKDELVAELAAAAQVIAEQAGAGGYASLGAKAGAAALKASLGDGYYVRTTSYLFQLNWNDTVYQKLGEVWEKPEAYENADFFGLKFIGKETGWSQVKAGIFSNKSEEELTYIATVNAMDAVLAKLEKKYEVFKTKVPLLTVEPNFTAAIGMKEGLKAGDKFEVLEKIVDPETNITSYKRRGVLKVSKDQIWDNRYMASEERALSGDQQNFQTTRFEGKIKDAYVGMLLRQIK